MRIHLFVFPSGIRSFLAYFKVCRLFLSFSCPLLKLLARVCIASAAEYVRDCIQSFLKVFIGSRMPQLHWTAQGCRIDAGWFKEWKIKTTESGQKHGIPMHSYFVKKVIEIIDDRCTVYCSKRVSSNREYILTNAF